MNLFDLTGRVAIVTGGNGGIGLGMAKGLAGAGAAVLVAGRNVDKNAAAVKELVALGAKADAISVDVTKEDQCVAMVKAATDKFGRVDILVNNAGTSVRKAPQDLSESEWHYVMDTNLTSAFLASKAAHPAMKQAGGGKVIHIGSMMTIFGTHFATAYGASKGGIVQMGRAQAAAWAADNIQVNSVLPGYISTALTDKAKVEVEGLNERVLARTPAKRWGVPEDLAGVAVFLASKASDFVTGTAIPIDGGYSMLG